MAANEEELRIKISSVLESEVISKFGLTPGRYEYTFISGGRPDALYGHVLIEYKAVGKLSKQVDVVKAKEQIIEYIKKEAGTDDKCVLFLGVIISDKIAFVRFNAKEKNWLIRGPHEINKITVSKLIEAIRGLSRKKLSVENLLQDFGPRSPIADKSVRIFYNDIIKSKNPKTEALFHDWKRLFSQVCAYSPDKLKGLEKQYEIKGSIDYGALLFAIHTYYALLMKLLAAEIAYTFGAGKWLKSYVSTLEDSRMKNLETFKETLRDIESGGIFRKLLNVTNFIEGDYFSWYLEELDEEMADSISTISGSLSGYEAATPILEPEHTKDLLKRLYQNLVPKKIRHDLGEYYTPDWLAELLLDEVKLTIPELEKKAEEKGDPTTPFNLRVLDPACGSGTFLISVIKRLKEYAELHFMKDILPSYVLRNVVGFDLNPLAVLTARTNYLLAMADVFAYANESVEIPVYLADSLLVETKTTLTGVSYVLRTYSGVFELPKSIVDKGILSKLLEVIDRFVRLGYSPGEFKQVVKGEFSLDELELKLVGELYQTFLRLEKEGKNHVWASIIRNAFAPLTIINACGKFNFVVGNPPWINWENLPIDYREATTGLWSSYRLLKRTKGMGLGKVKRDMAMLFVARCLDRFTMAEGKLGFLIPFTVYKTQTGAGFRDFLVRGLRREQGNVCPCRVLKIHDLVTLYPFEGATNRASLIVIKKKGETRIPIRCTLWNNPSSVGVGQEEELEDVKRKTSQLDLVFIPIDKNRPESSWMETSEKAYGAIKKVIGESPHYKAHAGVYTGLSQVYWVDILSEQQNQLLISNQVNPGQKKNVENIEQLVERDLVYPLVRGRDIKKWYVPKTSKGIIVPHDSKTGKPVPEHSLRVKYPKSYSYFAHFKKDLEGRAIHKLWGKRNPFYTLYDIGKYTFSPYKVVWKYISGKISGKGQFSVAVMEPVRNEKLGKKSVIPDHRIMTIPIENKEEAHYLAAVLNSSIMRLIVMSYTIETAISAHVMKNIQIAKFSSKDPLHLRLTELSIEAHEAMKKYREDKNNKHKKEVAKIGLEIDNIVGSLYGINDSEMVEVKKMLTVLGKGD